MTQAALAGGPSSRSSSFESERTPTHTHAPVRSPLLNPIKMAESDVRLPRVTIQFCTQCKWNLRAAYVDPPFPTSPYFSHTNHAQVRPRTPPNLLDNPRRSLPPALNRRRLQNRHIPSSPFLCSRLPTTSDDNPHPALGPRHRRRLPGDQGAEAARARRR